MVCPLPALGRPGGNLAHILPSLVTAIEKLDMRSGRSYTVMQKSDSDSHFNRSLERLSDYRALNVSHSGLAAYMEFA